MLLLLAYSSVRHWHRNCDDALYERMHVVGSSSKLWYGNFDDRYCICDSLKAMLFSIL
jgi:hypothetical protein